ncbi:MAG TPA: ATP-binding protein, partial [Chitinophagaceae bacterium]|nr:ATP-binding protein [Chitinophagaceae bacterium]
TVLEDKNGNLWIGTEAGVSRFDGTSFTNYTMADGLLSDAIDDIILDTEGVIWFGSKGFSALKGLVQDEKQNHSHGGELKPSNELSNAELKNGGFKPLFEIYNNKTGYPVKSINVMDLSRDGMIWAGTGGFLGDKLISFDFRNAYKNPNPPAVFIQRLKISSETVSWYDLKLPDISRDSKGVEQLVDSITTPPNIAEEGIVLGKLLSEEQRAIMQEKFNDVEFDSITRFYPLPVNLVLPYHHNNLTFDFVAIEPARPYLVRYQYMLEGYDKEWNPITDQTTAVFGNMREGSYTFRVKAQSPDGVWSEPVIYTFKVLPPWHRTWWAYTLYTLVFLTALWIFIKWRVRTLKKEKNILEEKVVKRTHELEEEKEKVESTLTELKATQAQLIQSEKMASLGELTAGIAHEIKNPLNFINNFSEINIELITEIEEEQIPNLEENNQAEMVSFIKTLKKNSEKINHHGHRVDEIVKGMLQHSRLGNVTKEPVNINSLCDESLKLAYHGFRAKEKTFNASFETRFDPDIPDIMVIPQDFGRVMLNLINNAFYTVNEKKKRNQSESSPGTLQAESLYKPSVIVSTKKNGNKIYITVSDNGMGIPSQIINKIFQPFFTTKPTGEGTGLGLSMSYDIITKSHGGELCAKSMEGLGTDFEIVLPV